MASSLRYHAEHRAATWLELFFDLVFVVAVGKITHALAHTHHHHLEPGVWWMFPLMLLPVWWIWLLHTLWNNLYDTDSKPHRAVSLLIMLQVMVLSTAMITDWEKTYPLFNGCYFVLRLTFAVLFFTHSKAHDRYQAFGRERGIVLAIVALVGVSSIFFDAPLRYGVFYLGLAIDMLHPLLLRLRGKSPPLHLHHLIERMGLLIIILMGESIIFLSAGLVDMHWDAQTITAAGSGIIMIGAAWWIYFDSYHRLGDGVGRYRDGLALMYPHFFTCLGLSIMANVIYHAIHPDLDRHEYQVMAMAGMVVFYIGKQVPYFTKYSAMRVNIIVNTAATLALCAGSLLLPSHATILMGMTIALLMYITLNYFTTIRKLRDMDAARESAPAATSEVHAHA